LKFATAIINQSARLVTLVDEGKVLNLSQACLQDHKESASYFDSMQAFLEAGPQAITIASKLVEESKDAAQSPNIHAIEDVHLLAPIPRPNKNIVCVGRNYSEHVAESKQLSGTAQPIPEHPLFFTKAYTCVIAPEDTIEFSRSVTDKVDYEGELVVVIGREGKDITPDKAMEYVFGYTLMNDVSARDLQFQHVQYFKGKSLDTFAPLGPWIVHNAEIPVYQHLQIQTHVNGELRQSAYLEDLIFDIPTLISVVSKGMTLHPGDLIATGTPSGVGGGFNPQRFLNDGDVVEVSIKEIGTLRNNVREL
jgi:2-keto-4-pentenoate hydratase/2-oxohepta-3-ene-1,7-dioic acid hydratase in catechol pathway